MAIRPRFSSLLYFILFSCASRQYTTDYDMWRQKWQVEVVNLMREFGSSGGQASLYGRDPGPFTCWSFLSWYRRPNTCCKTQQEQIEHLTPLTPEASFTSSKPWGEDLGQTWYNPYLLDCTECHLSFSFSLTVIWRWGCPLQTPEKGKLKHTQLSRWQYSSKQYWSIPKKIRKKKKYTFQMCI